MMCVLKRCNCFDRPTFNNYPAKSREISPDTLLTRPKAELVKIRIYSARFSRIIVLLFNTLITKHSYYRKAGDDLYLLKKETCNISPRTDVPIESGGFVQV